MEENDANKANYDELSSHITSIESRLSGLSGPKEREELHELKGDYYERAIQVRQMRVQTLEAILGEVSDKLTRSTAISRRLILQRRLVVMAMFVVAACALAVEFYPDVGNNALGAIQTVEAATHAACLCFGGFVVWRWSRRPEKAAV